MPLLALTGLLGGVLGLFALSPFCPDFAGLRQQTANGSGKVAADGGGPAVVPYGVAITAAALLVTVPPRFS